MGYRSDIYLKTTKEGYKALEKEIKKNELGYELWTTPDKLLLNGFEVTMEWDYLKWYPEFEDVRTIEDAIDEMSDKYPIHFVRIGEDMEDIDDRWYYPDDYSGDFDGLDIIRTVETYGREIDGEELFNE